MEQWFTSIMRFVHGPAGGRGCRSCGASIDRGDEFGQSEGVCTPCRRHRAS
jgi:hypothetical protein